MKLRGAHVGVPAFEVPLLRVHFWLRLMLLVQAWLLALMSASIATHPVLLALVCGVMLGWTVFTSWGYLHRPCWRWLPFLDLVLTWALVSLTGPVRGVHFVGLGMSIAGYWIAGAPLVVSILHGWRGGLAAAVAMDLASWVIAPERHDAETWSSALVVIVACTGVGYVIERMRAATAERDAYYATAAALGERERLSRIVHDGVLQVLAMMEREGPQLGPRGVRLAHEAREQEVALRALLQDKNVDVTVGEIVDPGLKSLTSALDRHESETVSISVLADDVVMPAATVDEIDAVVGEVLANVAKHAGPDAKAFLLLEEEDDAIVLSIRDNGVGARQEDILQAGRRGRLGVQDSVCGRIRDLGGTATLTAAPGRGVEWEFRIPREQ